VRNSRVSKLITNEYQKYTNQKLEPAYILNFWVHPHVVALIPEENHFAAEFSSWTNLVKTIIEVLQELKSESNTCFFPSKQEEINNIHFQLPQQHPQENLPIKDDLIDMKHLIQV